MIETPSRLRIDLNRGWDFLRRRARTRWLRGSGSSELIVLPHCWNASDTYQEDRRSYSGWGSYRRRVQLPKNPSDGGILWRLKTGGFYGVGDVWIDGRRLARVDGQYLGITHDLPTSTEDAEHWLAVRLDNRWRRDVLPGFRQPDFILHGGLAGGMWLEGLPETHFDVDRVAISSEPAGEDEETLTLAWAIRNRSSNARRIAVAWSVTDADGSVVGQTKSPWATIQPESEIAPCEASVVVDAPRCWSPDHPHLYRAVGRLLVDDSAVDTVAVRFGITRAEFRPRSGLHLNGRRIDLHGCNRHEAIPGFGNALPAELHRRDAGLLKEIGCTFVRLSHYPQSPDFLDACDELGILVYAEIATWKSVRSSAGWRRSARRQLRDLIIRDRHHPSILLWGMGNESRSRKAYLELRSLAKELDPARPVTYAENHLYRAKRSRTTGIPDVWGVNYELDVLEKACASSRLENVVVSECCNHPASHRGDDRQELVQVAAIERDWDAMNDRPYLAGHAVWSFTDYATEHRGRVRRSAGLFDAWRRPKLGAELFRARYAPLPFVSLFVTRPGFDAPPSSFRKDLTSEDQGAAQAELHVFTNCDTVRLTRDGGLLAALEGALHYVIPLFSGFDELLATGSRGDTVVQDRLRRHGPADHIHIKPVPGLAGATVELDIEIHDGASTVVRDWTDLITLKVEGPGRLHSFNPTGDVEVIRGIGTGYVTVDDPRHSVVVTAAGNGVSPGIRSISAGGGHPVDEGD